MQPVLVQLIQQLRACESVEAGIDFQRDLLTRLLEVEKDRWEFKRAVTRMRNGKQPHPEAPELQPGRDPADVVACVPAGVHDPGVGAFDNPAPGQNPPRLAGDLSRISAAQAPCGSASADPRRPGRRGTPWCDCGGAPTPQSRCPRPEGQVHARLGGSWPCPVQSGSCECSEPFSGELPCIKRLFGRKASSFSAPHHRPSRFPPEGCHRACSGPVLRKVVLSVATADGGR